MPASKLRQHWALRVLLFAAAALHFTRAQFVATQLFQNLNFGATTPQVRIKGSLGPFSSTKAYTLWGWYRFNGETTAISNIITFRNKAASAQGPATLPNPGFPNCPITLEQIQANPALATQPGVSDNPNCYEVLNPTDTVNENHDILYVNYDLGELVDTTQNYSLIFLVQTGIDPNTKNSDMKIDGFVNHKFTKNAWTYFAISCDYAAGQGALYFQEFAAGAAPGLKTLALSFPAFGLFDSPELIIAGVENNPYFQSTSGFIGNIAYIEMGCFFTMDLKNLWIGFMSQSAYGSKGVVLELFFDEYDSNVIKSQGAIQKSFEITGANDSVFASNRNRVGVVLREGAKVDLQKLDFANFEGLRSMTFLLQFAFEEPLPDDFVIFRRGEPSMSGYLAISLIRISEGRRRLKLFAKGEVSTATWQTDKNEFLAKRQYKVIVGLSVNLANELVVVFWDFDTTSNLQLAQQNFIYDFSPKDASLIGNQDSSGYAGNFTFYRFTALNSASAAIQKRFSASSSANRASSATSGGATDDCSVRISFYSSDGDCLACRSTMATYDRKCADFCPFGYKNATSDVCLKCFKEDCNEMDLTRWQATLSGPRTYRIEPTRRLIGNPKLDSLFSVQFDASNATTGQLNYTLTANNKEQYVDLVLDIQANLINQTLRITPKNDSGIALYDVNRNFLSPEPAVVTIERICFVSPTTQSAMKGLAIFVLVLFLLSFLVLLGFTLFRFDKFEDLGTVWKFFLHNCVKFQFVALLVLLGVYMPCCVKAFLDVLFGVLVGWDKALSEGINQANADSADFAGALRAHPVPRSFAEQGLQNYVLHNLGIIFIVNLALLVVYLGFKIWDVRRGRKSPAVYKVFILVEFTMVIGGYALSFPQATVFEFLNLRFPVFAHSYFGVCYIIALCYLLVFAGFWLYSAIRLCGPSAYFMEVLNFNKLYYFFAGYKERKMCLTYDLWFYMCFFVSLMSIGALFDSPVTQTTLILVSQVVLLVATAVFRPWVYLFQFLVELVCQVLLLVVLVIMLAIAAYDRAGCYTCGNREGLMCYLIVAAVCLYFVLLAGGMIAQTLLMVFKSNKFYAFGRGKSMSDEEVEHLRHSQRSMFDATARASRANDSNQPLMHDVSHSAQFAKDAHLQGMGRFEDQGQISAIDMTERQTRARRAGETDVDHSTIDRNLQFGAEGRLAGDDSQVDFSNANYRAEEARMRGAYAEADSEHIMIRDEGQAYRETFNRDNNRQTRMEGGYPKATMDNFMQDVKRQRNVVTEVTMGGRTFAESLEVLGRVSLHQDEMEDNRAFQRKHLRVDTIQEADNLPHDQIDEEHLQPSLLKAISVHNRSIDLDDNRSELYQKKRFISRKKEQFYRTRSQENIDPNRGPKTTSIADDSSVYQVNAYDKNMDKYRKLRIGEDDSVGDNDLSVYSNKTRVLQENRRDVNAINRVESSRINGLFFGSGIEEKPFGVDSFASSNRFA